MSVFVSLEPESKINFVAKSNNISKCLVGLMNGEIGFVSLPKIGSTFTFTAVFTNGGNSSYSQKIQQINQQSGSIEFQGMKAIVVDSREVRAKSSRYHIQRLGIQVEVVSGLNHGLSVISCGKKVVDIVLVEQEVWDEDLGMSGLFVSRLMNFDQGVPPKVFLLANSVNSSRNGHETLGNYYPYVIVKPLRASMLAASLQRATGVKNRGNYQNGELPNLSLRSLLLGRKILVVDDNNVNLRVAAGALKKYGADVVCADSGKKAISLLEPPHQFDACFMDIQMPEMDGFEATRRIRDMESNINDRIQHGELLRDAHKDISRCHIPIMAMTADVIHATNEECLLCDRSIAVYDLRMSSPARKLIMQTRTNSIAWNPREPMNFTAGSRKSMLYNGGGNFVELLEDMDTSESENDFF